jgi:hypothetical protein
MSSQPAGTVTEKALPSRRPLSSGDVDDTDAEGVVGSVGLGLVVVVWVGLVVVSLWAMFFELLQATASGTRRTTEATAGRDIFIRSG